MTLSLDACRMTFTCLHALKECVLKPISKQISSYKAIRRFRSSLRSVKASITSSRHRVLKNVASRHLVSSAPWLPKTMSAYGRIAYLFLISTYYHGAFCIPTTKQLRPNSAFALRQIIFEKYNNMDVKQKQEFLRQLKFLVQPTSTTHPLRNDDSKSALDELAQDFSHSLYVLDTLIKNQRIRHRKEKMLELTRRMLESIG